MKQHVFQPGEDIEHIARQHGFLLPATIWEDPSNDTLRAVRGSAYALAPGDVIRIPDLQLKQEDASDERRHVFTLRGLVRPAFYSRLVPDGDLPAARFGPVFSQPGAVGFDVSFAPHLSGALAHAASAHEGARFHAVFAARGRLADAALMNSVAQLLLGNRDAWVSDALGRHEEADLRALLTWVANVLGFPCDPGKPGTALAQGVNQALRRFRAAWNIHERAFLLRADLEPRPAEDWPTLFDAIEDRVRAGAGLSKEQISAARAKIQLLSPAWVDLTRSDGIEGTNPSASLDLVLFDEQVVNATPGSVHPLLSKLSAFMYSSLASKEAATTPDPIRPDLLEFEDVHFGPGRSVLLPTELTAAGPDEDWGLTGADVLVAALRHADLHPNRTILITGHTDSTSTKSANLVLSKRRAESVRMMLVGMGVIDTWTDLAAKHGTAEDAWEYLRWISERFGYGCWPSPADAPSPAKDAKALVAFRRRYNEDVKDFAPAGNPYQPAFTKPLDLRGPLSRDDWRAFFEMTQRYFTRQLRISMGELIDRQCRLKLGNEGLGCGESHPIDEEERERRRLAMYEEENLGERPGDRRVQIIFLDPDEFPLLGTPLLCHPTPDAGACKPELCKLYDQKFFEFRRLSAEPQRGKIEIIERTVWRNPRLFTEDTDEFREEVSGDFTPILHEKVQILVRVTPPYTPFEGFLELRVGRRTDDDEKPMSIVATLPWIDPNTNGTIVTLDGPRYFIIEWDGHATESVPREYSDRQICDEIQCKMVNIPMMEMEPGQRAKHGPYFVDRVTLFEKDMSVVSQHVPDEEEQNEFAMVVQVVLSVYFDAHPWETLNILGFGATSSADTVPFVGVYVQAVVARFRSHLSCQGPRIVGSHTEPALAVPLGLRIKIRHDQYKRGEGTALGMRGGTPQTFKLDGADHYGNHFLWYDEFDRHQPGTLGVGALSPRDEDAFCYPGTLVEATSFDAEYATVADTFSRVGYPQDRRVKEVPNNTSGDLGMGSPTRKELVGSVNAPREVDSDGAVVGQIMHVDETNCVVEVDSFGQVGVATMNHTLVPKARAQDIERALNAAVAYVSHLAAHEAGHLLGATVDPGQTGFMMPDGSRVSAYMNQDEAGHDNTITSTGLMVAGDLWPLDQTLGLVGPAREFRAGQEAYLKTMMPRAQDFASRRERTGNT